MTAPWVSDRPFPEESKVEGGSALHPSSPPRTPAMSPRGPLETTVATPEGSKGCAGYEGGQRPGGDRGLGGAPGEAGA